MIILNNVKHSLTLNLSNQANTIKSKNSNLSQYNFLTILGLEYLNTVDTLDKNKSVPVSIKIDQEGSLSINGLDGEMIDEKNIYVYTDKKVTKSDQ